MTDTHLHTTRADYDAMATVYAEKVGNSLTGRPLDRALVTAFAEIVLASGGGQVADLGCGPGLVTGHLHQLGLDAFGIDLSPEMIALARDAHPGLRFAEGSITELDIADGALAGILAWYSVIHTPPELLPVVIAEFHRVLAPGGHLLLGFFQTDDDSPHLAEPFDHKVSLAYRLSLPPLADSLDKAGFDEMARTRLEPGDNERFLQGRLLVRKR